MKKTFNELTAEDKELISQYYYDETKLKETAQLELSKKFGVTERTIRSWANKLGLNVMKPNAETIKSSPAKVLIFDIETSPLKGYFWGLFKQNIGTGQLVEDWIMLTWSAKWLFDEEVLSDRLTSKEALDRNDKRIVQSLHKLIDEADIVIAHNGKKFDIKKINTRFINHKLPQPKPYEVIDTLLHARKNFSVTSNKLDYLGEFFGVGRKIPNAGFQLWIDCVNGSEEALIEMETYNKGDVTLLEDVYLMMRSYIKPHPNMGLHIKDDIQVCPTCGSEELSYHGDYRTSVNVFQNYICNSCGSHSRSRKSDGIGRKYLLTPTAR